MASDDRLRRAASCCTNILGRYGGRAPTPASRDLMVAEVEVLAGWLLELDLPPGAVEDGFLPPVEFHLVARHGLDAGRRLHDEVIAVLDRAGLTSPGIHPCCRGGPGEPAPPGPRRDTCDDFLGVNS